MSNFALTDLEFFQRILGRIEAFIGRSFDEEEAEAIIGLLRETYSSYPSEHFNNLNAVIQLRSRSASYAVPASAFLVKGYNQFNLENEFKGNY